MSSLIFGIAARQLSAEQAKDIVAETFTVVWQRRESCPAGAADWPAWTVGIAKNKIARNMIASVANITTTGSCLRCR